MLNHPFKVFMQNICGEIKNQNKGRKEKSFLKGMNRRNLTIHYTYIYQSNYQILQDQWNLHPKMTLIS